MNNPLHQFDKGLVEKNQIVLNVRWELKPTEWSDYVGFGSYSDAKYMFIMDVCQRIQIFNFLLLLKPQPT